MLIWSEEFSKEAKEQFKDGFNEAVRADKCSYSIPIGYWPFDRYSSFEVKGFNPTEWGENYWDEVKEDLFPNVPNDMMILSKHFNLTNRVQVSEVVRILEHKLNLDLDFTWEGLVAYQDTDDGNYRTLTEEELIPLIEEHLTH